MDKKMVEHLLLLAAILLAPAMVCAAQPASGAPAPVVRIGIDQAILPFSDKETDSGLEVEVIRAALVSQKIPTQFEYLANSRIDKEFASQTIDIHTAAVPGPEFAGALLSHFPIATLKNEAIYLKAKDLKLRTIADLSGLRVMAWQGASEVLGPLYARMAKTNPHYRELPTMPTVMLKLDRVDVFVSQPDIFRANLLKGIPQANVPAALAEVGYANLLPGSMRYWYAFHDPKLRDAFELGLQHIYQSGEMEALLNKYRDELGTSRSYFIELDCRFMKNRPRCPA